MPGLNFFHSFKNIVKKIYKNRENIKSVLLTVLILLSLILTWTLWTYKPNYGVLENPRTLKQLEVPDVKTVTDVIQPSQILKHTGDKISGVVGNEKFERKAVSQLKNTRFYDPQIKTFDPDDTRDFKNGEYIEMVFPANMPPDVYSQIFNLSGNGNYSLDDVDRVYFYTTKTNEIRAWLVSYPKKQKIVARTSFAYEDFKKAMNEAHLVPFTKFDDARLNNKNEEVINRRFYFPTEHVTFASYSFYTPPVKDETIERYKKALFKDQMSIKSSSRNSREYYTDDKSEMDIFNNRLTYTNFALDTGEGDVNVMDHKSVLFDSVNFVNTHAGWGGSYFLSSLSDNEATFHLEMKGLPVLSPEMELRLSRENNEINKYSRSLLKMTELVNKSKKGQSIESAKEVISRLKNEYDLTLVEDVRIGYEMSQVNGQVCTLEPKWFIREGDEWQPLFVKDE
ncbi:YycH family regulatory protein [Fictibacillus gelatini]|uniref:YycH family regulatory protein n=1 Tax=Fictibacillus gelatini TaxID=225985 RepID=UPI00041327F5|nr:two-component system activity regulator YycH [Fictibacillus gelatini]